MNEMKMVYKPRANFIKTTPDMKMLGLKSILGYIEPLYGPYAGTATLNISGTTALHTKDGNSCIGRIAMDDHLANTLLNVIRDSSELALEKSGDGTTSAAMLSALVAYNLFQNDKKSGVRTIPSVVESKMDTALAYLEKGIHESKVSILKGDTFDKDMAMAIVNTSLDRNRKFDNVFETIYTKMDDMLKSGRTADDLVFRFIEKPDSYEESTVSFARGYKLFQTPIVNSDAFNWDDARVTYIQDSVDTVEDNALMFQLLNDIDFKHPGKHLIIFKNISAGFKNALENLIISEQTNPQHPIHNFRFISIPTNTQDALNSISDLRVMLGEMSLSYKKEPVSNQTSKLKLPPVFNAVSKEHYTDIAPSCQITYNGSFLVISPNDVNHNKREVEALIDTLKKAMNAAESKESIYFISPKDRLELFQSEVAVISVTGTTAIEVERYKTQLDDAIRAFKSAVKEGVLAGANCTVPRLISQTEVPEHLINELEAIGNAYLATLKCIYGSGLDLSTNESIFNLNNNELSAVVKEVLSIKNPLETINVYTGKPEKTVLEPVSTTIGVLRGAVSAAKMIYVLRMIQLMGTADDRHLHVLSEHKELHFD
ncbi:MAG: hypothetical protein ACRCX2_21640 [Paraclostridium sp.]